MTAIQEQPVQTPHGSLNVALGPENGPPLLFLHGVCRRWQDFLPLLAPLSLRWQVIAPDFRGHGASFRKPGGYRVVDYVEDALACLDLAPSPLAIYGHSLGAMVACGAAAAAGERVSGIVLEDPPFETLGSRIFRTPFHSLFCGMQLLAGESERPTGAVAADMAEIRLPGPQGPATLRLGDVRNAVHLRFGARCLQYLDPQVLTPLTGGAWLEGFDAAALLPRVRCPSLLLVGDVDRGGMLPGDDANRVSSLLPDCARIDVAGAGHLLHWSHTQEVLNHTTLFLESL